MSERIGSVKDLMLYHATLQRVRGQAYRKLARYPEARGPVEAALGQAAARVEAVIISATSRSTDPKGEKGAP